MKHFTRYVLHIFKVYLVSTYVHSINNDYAKKVFVFYRTIKYIDGCTRTPRTFSLLDERYCGKFEIVSNKGWYFETTFQVHYNIANTTLSSAYTYLFFFIIIRWDRICRHRTVSLLLYIGGTSYQRVNSQAIIIVCKAIAYTVSYVYTAI